MFRVLLGSMMVVIGGVQRMAVSDLRMVGCFFVVPRFVMLRRFVMVLGRLLVVVRGLLVVFVNVVIHDPLLG
jgi:hypothetical protein